MTAEQRNLTPGQISVLRAFACVADFPTDEGQIIKLAAQQYSKPAIEGLVTGLQEKNMTAFKNFCNLAIQAGYEVNEEEWAKGFTNSEQQDWETIQGMAIEGIDAVIGLLGSQQTGILHEDNYELFIDTLRWAPEDKLAIGEPGSPNPC